MHKFLLASVAAFALLAGPTLANDTMAELKTGGLFYIQAPDVSMASEDLYISPSKVTVDYVFRNTGEKDVAGLIAFPMPDISGSPASNVAVPDLEADNFLGFSVTQDDEAIEPELQQRAVTATGIDVTAELEEKGIPLLPFSEKTTQALEKLPAEVIADWTARGILIDDHYDAGNGWEHHPLPIWTLKSVYYWNTTFPAGEDVAVHHEYTPSVGATTAMNFIYDGKANADFIDDYKKRFCVDDAFLKLAIKLDAAARAEKGPLFFENWISYVLTTGANWSGPIGKFHLTVDKGNEKNFVSFCGEGVKKTGATTFEMTAEEFFPQKDLDILLLVPAE